MKKSGLKTLVLAALAVMGAETLRAQPTASPTSFNFTYQVNSTTLPTPGKLTATMSKTAPSGYTLTASVSPPMSWLTVTPGGGTSPLDAHCNRESDRLKPGKLLGRHHFGHQPGNQHHLG